jgi:hypothetical protein
MYISPRHLRHNMPSTPIEEWDTELLVDIFHARVDGWHLEVADRCINGWKDEYGIPSINTKHLDGRPTNHVPDSGWAVLQITLNYFETIAFFKGGGTKAKPYDLFVAGVFDVFPEQKGLKPNIAKYLWSDLRTGLYHGGINNAKTHLIHRDDIPPIHGDERTGIVIIDPHHFVRRLRKHLNDYCLDLLDISKGRLRDDFRKAFIAKFG